MRKWLYKIDESGRPRRFLGHGEALSWAALRVGNYAGPTLAIGLVVAIFDPAGLGRDAVLALMVMILAACAAAVAGVYLYVALSGGVMGGEERRLYFERLRESRRGRW